MGSKSTEVMGEGTMDFASASLMLLDDDVVNTRDGEYRAMISSDRVNTEDILKNYVIICTYSK